MLALLLSKIKLICMAFLQVFLYIQTTCANFKNTKLSQSVGVALDISYTLLQLTKHEFHISSLSMSLPFQRSPELSFHYCLQNSSLSMSICIQRSPKLTVVVHSKCSTLQAHLFVYLYQMLAGFLSPYQL